MTTALERRRLLSYFFLRLRDSATVVYKVADKDGKVYHVESSHEEPDEQRWLVKPKAGTVSSGWRDDSSATAPETPATLADPPTAPAAAW